MNHPRWRKTENLFFVFVFMLLNTLSAFAGPSRTTYQAKIVKPDGYPLEATSTQFKFTILDPSATCILYSETYSNVNMANTGGLISFSLGAGVKTYPLVATTFEQIFSNITPNMACDTGGGPPAVYTPLATDSRKIVMQFNDGNGWQTLPAMSINAVPYAMYANDSQKLNGMESSDFVQISNVTTCGVSEALTFNGASFSCIAAGSGSGSVTSGSVITALGYTPADGVSVTALSSSLTTTNATVSSVSSSVFAVSATVSSLAASVSGISTTVSGLSASLAALVSSQWSANGDEIYYNSGFVGIGTSTPMSLLEIVSSTASVHINLSGSDTQGASVRYFSKRGTASETLGSANPTGNNKGWSVGSIGDQNAAPTRRNNFEASFWNGTAWSTPFVVTASGSVGIGTFTPVTRLDVSGGVRIGAEAASCSAALAGTLRYNAGAVEYCNGSSWAAFGVSGAGLTLLNGSASNTQTFANGTAGNAPAFNTVGGVHTLNIPLASATGSVTAGLISNADYVSFSNKLNATSAAVNTALGFVPANAVSVTTLSSTLENFSTMTATSFTTFANNMVASFAAITSSQWVTSGTSIHYNSGNVGIGTDTPNMGGSNGNAGVLTISGNGTDGSSDGRLEFVNPKATVAANESAGRLLWHMPNNGVSATSKNIAAMTVLTEGSGGTDGFGGKIIFYARANNSIASVNSFPRMTITSSGSVGIGTTSPLSILDLNNSYHTGTPSSLEELNNKIALWSNAGVPTYGLGISTLGLNITAGQSNSSIRFHTNGAFERMRISSSGNVGIGNTNPNHKLVVGDDIGVLSANNAAVIGASGTGSTQLFLGNDGNNFGNIRWDGTNKQLIIRTKGNGTLNTNQMVLDQFGNIGIGLDTPSARLHLAAGSVASAPLKLTSGTLLSSPASGAIEYDGFNYYITNGANVRRAIATVASPGTLDNTDLISNAGNIMLYPNNGTGSVIVSATTASTNSSTGALVVRGGLGVAGNINASGTIITSSNIQGVSITATNSMITPYLYGSTANGGNLVLDSTTHATKGFINIAPNGGTYVGIGKTAPAFTVDVSGTVNVSSNIPDVSLVSASAMAINLRVHNGDSDFGGIGMIQTSPNNGDTTIFYGDDVGDDLRFVHSRSASPNYQLYEYMRLTSDGKFGLGTSTPSYKMDIYEAASPTLRIRSASNDTASGPIIKLTEDLAENGGFIRYHSMNNSMDMGVLESGAENTVLSINRTTGNLGIGGASIAGAKVAIQGAGAVGLQIKTTGAGAIDTMNLINDMDATGQFWFAKGTVASAAPTTANRLFNITNEGNFEFYGQAVTNANDKSGIISIKTQSSADGGQRNEGSLEFYTRRTNLDDRTGYVGFETNDDNLSVMPAYGALVLGASSTERARVTSAGLSIKTTSAIASLHVNGGALIGSGNTTFTNDANHVVGNSNSIVGGGSIGSSLLILGSSNVFHTSLAGFSWNSVLAGRSNVVSGTSGNVAVFGHSNTLTNAASAMTFGFGNTATAVNAFTFGTGVSNTVANSLQFGMSNSAKMTILQSNGNVGVNTTAPTQVLDVVRTTGDGSIRIKTDAGDSDAGVVLQNDARTWKISTKAGYADAFVLTDVSAGLDALVVKAATGNVGIGTVTPAYKLEVSGGARLASSNGSDIWTERPDSDVDIRQSTASTKRAFSIHAGAGGSDIMAIYYNNAGTHDPAFFVKNNGRVGVFTGSPTERLHVVGNLRVQGSTDCTLGNGAGGTNCSSDIRLKENIKPIPYALDKVLSLRGVEFDWNNKSASPKRHDIGVIAQDVEKVFPTAVVTDNATGFKKVDYAVLVAPLIQAFKEFNARLQKLFDRSEANTREIASIQEENAELKKRVEQAEQKNQELEKRLERLEKALTDSNAK